FVVITLLALDERQGQAVAGGVGFLVVAELLQELRKLGGGEGEVLVVIGAPGGGQQHGRLLFRRVLGAGGAAPGAEDEQQAGKGGRAGEAPGKGRRHGNLRQRGACGCVKVGGERCRGTDFQSVLRSRGREEDGLQIRPTTGRRGRIANTSHDRQNTFSR